MRRIIALAAALALAVLGVTAWAAGGADATTLTCTNIAHAVTTPIGCGGAQSATTAHGTLDMAVIGTANASGNYFNSPVGVKTESLSATREDFTVFALGGSITGGLGGLGSYVVMYTPNGHINSWTHVSGPTGVSQPAPGEHFNAGFSDFCVSVTQIPNGPHGALRWNAILRNCSSNGVFTMGDNAAVSPVENSSMSALFVPFTNASTPFSKTLPLPGGSSRMSGFSFASKFVAATRSLGVAWLGAMSLRMRRMAISRPLPSGPATKRLYCCVRVFLKSRFSAWNVPAGTVMSVGTGSGTPFFVSRLGMPPDAPALITGP